MNHITTIPEDKATLVDIRTDNRRFPRLHSYKREEAVYQMNIIVLMAYQYRGQQADALTITNISSSLIDLLNADEYGIGTKFLSFEEIKRVVRKAALGQGREMYGISVSSLYQALADYCKGEGKVANEEARQVARRQKELKDAIVAPMIPRVDEMLRKSRTMYDKEATRKDQKNPVGNQVPVK